MNSQTWKWLRALLKRLTKASNLNFDGGGRVSVSVASILNSEHFKRQMEACREIKVEGRQ